MTQGFIKKVIENGVVDTKTYRYKVFELHDLEQQYRVITRLPLSSLGTTNALNGLELIWDSRENKA